MEENDEQRLVIMAKYTLPYPLSLYIFPNSIFVPVVFYLFVVHDNAEVGRRTTASGIVLFSILYIIHYQPFSISPRTSQLGMTKVRYKKN